MHNLGPLHRFGVDILRRRARATHYLGMQGVCLAFLPAWLSIPAFYLGSIAWLAWLRSNLLGSLWGAVWPTVSQQRTFSSQRTLPATLVVGHTAGELSQTARQSFVKGNHIPDVDVVHHHQHQRTRLEQT